MQEVQAATKRGPYLDGALFHADGADTIVIGITGIHGNFYSNPFYYVFGDVLTKCHIDFLYAQTNDAFGQIETRDAKTGKPALIGSYNENFADIDDDIEAWLKFAQEGGYRRLILAGHSLGANKVIYYLARHPDAPCEHFILLSPADVGYLLKVVSEKEKRIIQAMMEQGRQSQLLPFPILGWIQCLASTGYQWVFANPLNNVQPGGDFSQLERIHKTGAIIIGGYDRFTEHDPEGFIANINRHMPSRENNILVVIPGTGHTCQQKEKETAEAIRDIVLYWQGKRKSWHSEKLAAR